MSNLLDRILEDMQLVWKVITFREDLYHHYLNAGPFALIVLFAMLLTAQTLLIVLSFNMTRRSNHVLNSAIFLNKYTKYPIFILGPFIALAVFLTLLGEFVRVILTNEAVITNALQKFADFITSSPAFSSLFCLFFGVFAYFIRSRARSIYASIELFAGIFSAYLSSGFNDPAGSMQFAGGLYIIVRALDNYKKSFEGKPRFKLIWDWIFGRDA